jgi:hypothetical protein
VHKLVEVENISEMRHREGIEEDELWQQIGKLRAGDDLKLSLGTPTTSFETVSERITSIRGSVFRAKLASKPATSKQSELTAGSFLVFAATQIHSVVPSRAMQRADMNEK